MDKKLEKLFNDYHVVSCKMLLENGYTKYQIMNLVKKGFLYRVRKGLYRLHNEIDDEFHIYQKNNSYIVYSNETALYLHNLTDRFPNPLSVTTKSGYHVRNKKLKVYYVKEEFLDNNVVILNSPQGNPIYVYDIERTICDIVKNKNRMDPQVYIQGLQNYFLRGKPNLRKLSKISKLLNIQQKMMSIIELYVKP
ncbi:hypothetical protein DWZ83_11055 [Amedibacillus dolichus]|uniref:Abortive phage infection protein n=2 Tax=Amedibacillus dolichus TaxID=31971 RepID=A0A415NS96_9FIRM|nr:type IV toxin-antitoxin system AbiEi family antitoxin domain-containing protein [Amedibacillus dolichus]EDP11678.1 hypothetical protein EUBDOL_00857 [Amedibacillus dolichus DSM 3991]RHM03324.1 hypothetical protein DWZ83_11055 [Amedibacillus dolichus]